MKDLLPIQIIHYDPVSRQVVELEQFSCHKLLCDYSPPQFFDVSNVNVPADRMFWRENHGQRED